jgi:hypothetical protein
MTRRPPRFIARSAHPTTPVERIVALTRAYSLINPAATQRQIQALTAQLLTITTTKAGLTAETQVNKAHAYLRQRIRPSAHLDVRQQVDGLNLWINPRLWITSITRRPCRA